jgi:hypothetical protein
MMTRQRKLASQRENIGRVREAKRPNKVPLRDEKIT